jgi:hypothetical protein
VIFPSKLWISGLGLFFNGLVFAVLFINLMVKILLYGTAIYSFRFEALVCECLAAAFVLFFSVAGIVGPVFGLIFSFFLNFSSTCVVVGIISWLLGAVFYRMNKESLLSVNAVETEPQQIDDHRNQLEKSENSENLEDLNENLKKKSIFSSNREKLQDSNENYEYNFFSIQSGYSDEEFPSFPSKKEISEIRGRMSGNQTVQVKRGNTFGETIFEQKNEESSGDKHDLSKFSKTSKTSKFSQGSKTPDPPKPSPSKKIQEKSKDLPNPNPKSSSNPEPNRLSLPNPLKNHQKSTKKKSKNPSHKEKRSKSRSKHHKIKTQAKLFELRNFEPEDELPPSPKSESSSNSSHFTTPNPPATEKSRPDLKFRTQPPVFIDLSVPEPPAEEFVLKTVSQHLEANSSSEAIKDLNEMFPEDPFKEDT